MMQGCCTPPPPPTAWYALLACQVGSRVVWPCCFPRLPGLSCLASSPPTPVEWGLWSFWLAPPRLCGAVCSTEVWYGCCRLVVVMSSLRALSPPPLWGGACAPFGWPRPACVGQCVLHRYVIWLLRLVSSNVVVTCSLPYKI